MSTDEYRRACADISAELKKQSDDYADVGLMALRAGDKVASESARSISIVLQNEARKIAALSPSPQPATAGDVERPTGRAENGDALTRCVHNKTPDEECRLCVSMVGDEEIVMLRPDVVALRALVRP